MNPTSNEPTKTELQDFLSITSMSYANAVLTALNHLKKYKDAFDSEIGGLFIKDIKMLIEQNADKVVNNTATDIEKAEILACKKLLMMWGDRYLKYQNGVKIIQDAGKRKKH